jgi:hypothetical protein
MNDLQERCRAFLYSRPTTPEGLEIVRAQALAGFVRGEIERETDRLGALLEACEKQNEEFRERR